MDLLVSVFKYQIPSRNYLNLTVFPIYRQIFFQSTPLLFTTRCILVTFIALVASFISQTTARYNNDYHIMSVFVVGDELKAKFLTSHASTEVAFKDVNGKANQIWNLDYNIDTYYIKSKEHLDLQDRLLSCGKDVGSICQARDKGAGANRRFQTSVDRGPEQWQSSGCWPEEPFRNSPCL